MPTGCWSRQISRVNSLTDTVNSTERVGFGGGCHWCTEAVFSSLIGVRKVEQGFISAPAPDDTPSEAVLVNFDPQLIDLQTLIEVHLHTHASTSEHSMRGKYRSALYTFSDHQQRACEQTLQRLQRDFDAPLITRVLPFVRFVESDARYQNYYASNPEKPFCQNWISPKLQRIKAQFSSVYQSAGK